MSRSAGTAHDLEGATYDAVIVGDGVIGLSIALELHRRGAAVALLGTSFPAAGSGAAAGLLAPSIGSLDPKVRAFFRASLVLYPAFLEPLLAFDSTLRVRAGLLEIVAVDVDGGAAEPIVVEPPARRLGPAETAALAPGIHAPHGSILHPRDGAVDSAALLAALHRAVGAVPAIDRVAEAAVAIDLSRDPATVTTQRGHTMRARNVVLAAGAWSPLIGGLPRSIPIAPLKGQMLALATDVQLDRPVMSQHVYLVPREKELIVGATSEDAGFDATTTADAIEFLRAAAVRACPALSRASETRRWAGLRPATPDLLPILGRDPDAASLVYACGHSRNGILLAPATAVAIGNVIARATNQTDGLFSVTRFADNPTGWNHTTA